MKIYNRPGLVLIYARESILEQKCSQREVVITLFLELWLCSLASALVCGRLLDEDDGSRSLSLSFSPNQEKGMQVGMEVMDSEGETWTPDSSSNSAEPLKHNTLRHEERTCKLCVVEVFRQA